MSGGLLNKLPPMSQDESLGGTMLTRLDTVDKLGENDGFPTPSCKADTESSMTFPEVREDGLNAFFLISTKAHGRTGRWTQGWRLCRCERSLCAGYLMPDVQCHGRIAQ